MTRDIRMWTAFAWLTKGLVRGLVFTAMELRISLHNITIQVVETGVLSYDTGSRKSSSMWLPLVILAVETVILFGYLS